MTSIRADLANVEGGWIDWEWVEPCSWKRGEVNGCGKIPSKERRTKLAEKTT